PESAEERRRSISMVHLRRQCMVMADSIAQSPRRSLHGLLIFFWRGDGNALAFQSRPQCPREFDRARRIAMEANGFGPNRNVGSVHSANFSSLQHPQDALRRLRWIMQQRLRLRSRNERAVAIIVAVRKNFGCGLQAQFVRRFK